MKKYFLTNYRLRDMRRIYGLLDTILYYPEKPNPNDRLNKNLFGLELCIDPGPQLGQTCCHFHIEKRNEFFEILHTSHEKISNSNEIFLFIWATYKKNLR